MPQIFPPSANDYARISILGGLATLAFLVWMGASIHKSGSRTGEGVFLHQPVPFSHEHHVRGLGIDCRYCHTSVETSANAGIPPVATCMNCHRQIWTNSEMLEPVREALRTGVPIQWERVNDLPDFVYFNHAVHVAKGIGCVECHGRVDTMPLTVQVNSLDMQWCLDCHRNPEERVRPRSRVFDLGWELADATAEDLAEVGMTLNGSHEADGANGSHAGRNGEAQSGGNHSGESDSGESHGGEAAGPDDAHGGLTSARLAEFQGRLAEEYDVESLMSCSVCHR